MKMRPPDAAQVARYAEMFSAIGAEPRLRILRLLLSAHPGGMNVGEIQDESGVQGSTLSHHLEKLRYQRLITVHREGTFLRYRADVTSLEDMLGFLYAECCTRNQVVRPDAIVQIGK
jgi:ArsR family transcriptional regulator